MSRFVAAATLLAISSTFALAQAPQPPQAPKRPAVAPGAKVPVKPAPAPATACDTLKGKAYLGLMMTSLAGNVSPGFVRFERKGGVKGFYWTQSASAGPKAGAPTPVQIVKAECKSLAPDKASVQYFSAAGPAGVVELTIMEGGSRLWGEGKTANPPQSGWLMQMK